MAAEATDHVSKQTKKTSKENIAEKLCGAFTRVDISDFTVKQTFGTRREAFLTLLFVFSKLC